MYNIHKRKVIACLFFVACSCYSPFGTSLNKVDGHKTYCANGPKIYVHVFMKHILVVLTKCNCKVHYLKGHTNTP